VALEPASIFIEGPSAFPDSEPIFYNIPDFIRDKDLGHAPIDVLEGDVYIQDI
jgi:hypothetical protein